MPRTLLQVDNDLTALETRVAQLDGQTLTDPDQSTVNQITAQINGLNQTIRQIALLMEAELVKTKAKVTSLEATLDAHLNP